MNKKWEPVIGLEIHAQLMTKSKIFSGAATTYGAEANTQTCGLDVALPGTLPILNEKALELALRFGLSIQAEIPRRSVFSRKNYFYPDLPKGYQISQYDKPIVGKGRLIVQMEDGSSKQIGILRAHLEEDAGKSIHEGLPNATGIDLNRAGIPLLEIVSEPDMRSAKEAVAYMKTLHGLVRHLGVCDGNMQEGSFRCDVNISLRPYGQKEFGTRAEIKNLNSFRFVERAIEYEIERQTKMLEAGEKIIQETRLYDSNKDITRSMRSKESAHDYRYFPDPDLLPIEIDESFIQLVRETMPELPWDKFERFINIYGLSNYDARLLTSDIDMSEYFEETVESAHPDAAKLIANWMLGDLNAALNEQQLTIKNSPIRPVQLASLILRIHDKTITNTIGKTVFISLWQGAKNADEVIEKQGLKQITDENALIKIIDEVIANNPEQTAEYRAGKDKLFKFFVGQVMKLTKGQANPEQVNILLKDRLDLK